MRKEVGRRDSFFRCSSLLFYDNAIVETKTGKEIRSYLGVAWYMKYRIFFFYELIILKFVESLNVLTFIKYI